MSISTYQSSSIQINNIFNSKYPKVQKSLELGKKKKKKQCKLNLKKKKKKKTKGLINS